MLRLGEFLFDGATRRLIRPLRESRGTLNAEGARAELNVDEAKLSPKAAALLEALAETPGQIWSRDALFERVWPAADVGEEVLTQAIAELRRAFKDDFRSPRIIATVHKAGYRLLPTVEKPAAPASINLGRNGDFDLEAYESYLTACELYERGGRSATGAALDRFSDLTRSAPTFALAHVGVAKAAVFLDVYYNAESDLMHRARYHCSVAHNLGGAQAEAYAIQGLIFAVAGQFERSENCFRSSLQVDQTRGETHYLLGRACLAEMDISLSAIMFERAAKLQPDDYYSLLLAGKVREGDGEFERAELNYRLALQRIARRLEIDDTDRRARFGRIRCLWQLGRKEEANRFLDEELTSPADPMNYHVACTLVRAGRHEEALKVLEQVIELGWRHKSWLERDPDLRELRDYSDYKRLHAALA